MSSAQIQAFFTEKNDMAGFERALRVLVLLLVVVACTAPADVSEGVDRTLFRLWDPVTIRRVVSWLSVVFRDIMTSVLDGFTNAFALKHSLGIPSVHIGSADIYLLPSFSPGPLLVMLVTMVLFVL